MDGEFGKFGVRPLIKYARGQNRYTSGLAPILYWRW